MIEESLRSLPFADRELARKYLKISRAVAKTAARSAAEMDSDIAPPYIEVGHAFAVYTGEGSPFNQVYGLGWTDDLIDCWPAIVHFYLGRTTGFEVMTTPFDHDAIWELSGKLNIMLRHVNVLALNPSRLCAVELMQSIKIDILPQEQLNEWLRISLKGVFGVNEYNEAIVNLIWPMCADASIKKYLLTVDGVPAATGTLTVSDGIGYVGSTFTLEEFRGKGLQRALIARCVQDAMASCDLCFLETQPGGATQRNAERCGFQVAFTGTVWGISAESALL